MSFCSSRYSSRSRGTSWPMSASCSSTSASVEGPVLVFFRTGSWSLSNSTVPSCRGELRLNSVPAAAERFRSSSARSAVSSRDSRSKTARIDGDPGPLHVGEDFDQRELDLPEERFQRLVPQGRGKFLPAPAPSRRPPRRQAAASVTATSAKGTRSLPLPVTSSNAPQCPAQMLEAQGIHCVGAPAGIEHEARQHRVVGHTGQFDAGLPKHLPVDLDVVPGLGHRGILQEVPERRAGGIGEERKVTRPAPRPA